MNVCLVLFFLSCSAWAEDTLKAVTVLFRHGDRTPQTFYPTDPYSDPSFWPVRPGQLTNIGKRRHYELGQWFRRRYDGFMSQSYDPKEISVRSSNTDRCIMSAQCNLAGLYPPSNNDIWRKEIPWQPIPVHSVPEEMDDMLRMSKNCDKYDKLYEQLRKDKYFVDVDKKYSDLYQYLSSYTGLNIKTYSDVYKLYETLRIEELANFTLPEWTIAVYPDQLRDLYLVNVKSYTYTTEMARLGVGTFLHAVIKQFKMVSLLGRMHNRKFMMYSAHGSTIWDVINALGINYQGDVPYATALLLELYENEQESYVMTSIKANDVLTVLEIRNCTVKCPYKQFLNILKPISLSSDQREKECL